MTENKNAIQRFADSTLAVWDDKKQIKELFAPDLTDKEFDYFVSMGMSLGANPFKREIFAVKYAGYAAQVYTGRDFDRKKAQEQKDYVRHTSVALYENDEYYYDVVTGLPVYKPAKREERGNLVGAFALAWKATSDLPFHVHVEFDEYVQMKKDKTTGKMVPRNLWKDKPATMIAKVAEAQVLRQAWQAVFAGTYSESEQFEMEANQAEKYKAAPPTVDKNKDVPQADYIEEEPETDGVDSMALRERLKNNFPQQNDRISFVQGATGKVVKTVQEWGQLNDNDYSVISLALDKFEEGGE